MDAKANISCVLQRVEPGRYRTADGRFDVRGMRLRLDGGDGSRINRWLVTDSVASKRSTFATLSDVRRELATKSCRVEGRR